MDTSQADSQVADFRKTRNLIGYVGAVYRSIQFLPGARSSHLGVFERDV